jgi:hypothetical protein
MFFNTSAPPNSSFRDIRLGPHAPFHYIQRMNRLRNKGLWIFPAILLCLAGVSLSQDTVKKTEPSGVAMPVAPVYVVGIDRITVTDGRLEDTIALTLDSSGSQAAAFELEIGIESRFVHIDTILPGEIIDSCRWHFFNSRPVRSRSEQDSQVLLWQVVGIARTMPGADAPTCLGLPRKASLARIVVSSPPSVDIPDTTASIFFYWDDCTNNSIASPSGDTLAVSARVFDFYGNVVAETDSLFPNRTGTIDDCIDPSRRNRPLRVIDFHNGGVEFRLDVEPADSSRSQD